MPMQKLCVEVAEQVGEKKGKEGKMSVGVTIMPHLFLQSSMVPMSLALSAVCVNASLELATAVLER